MNWNSLKATKNRGGDGEGVLVNGTFKVGGLTVNGGVYPSGNYDISDFKLLPH